MRKTIFFLPVLLLLTSVAASAHHVEANASYVYSSRFDQTRVGAAMPLGLNASIGLEGKMVKDKISVEKGGFKNPVYSFYLPLQLDIDFVQLSLTPFTYLKNDSASGIFQDSSAYGINGQIMVDLVKDEIEGNHTQAFIGLNYARQKSDVMQNDAWKKENYDQAAFSLGIRQNFYDTFLFQAGGEIYVYPDGISRVQAFHGILDQKDLGFTQSYAVNRDLGKYTLSARVGRLWPERHASLYVAYHYGEFYTAQPEHSVIIGNTFALLPNVHMDTAYNHLRDSANRNKRDLFFINLNILF